MIYYPLSIEWSVNPWIKVGARVVVVGLVSYYWYMVHSIITGKRKRFVFTVESNPRPSSVDVLLPTGLKPATFHSGRTTTHWAQTRDLP